MAYQVGQEIGALAVALSGRVDAVILAGPLARDPLLVQRVRGWVQWIAPVLVYPGGDELHFLAEGAVRVLSGEERAKCYGDYAGMEEE
jgi:butyrate kinase